MALINWLLKLKMHANTFFLILFFMKIQYEIYMYIYIYMQHFKENCVFLQYKNTNQY
jgi:hypothetical protein